MKPSLLAALQRLEISEEEIAEYAGILGERPGRKELIKRLSLPRTFDADLYSIACRELEGAPAWEELPSLEDVEELPGGERLAIRPSVRENSLNEWSKTPDERARWAKDFLPEMDSNDPVERQDRLQLAFFADPPQARKDFRDAFDQADKADDLPLCAGLIQLLAPVSSRLDEDSKALFMDLRSRQSSRDLFRTEFYQTANYFERKAIQKRVLDFIDATAPDPWIYHIHGTGGAGKTTFLRWLISRRLVTSPRRELCLWLDFDYLDVSNILQCPWLISLPLAAQMQAQAPASELYSYLLSAMRFAPLLFRPRSDGSARGDRARAGAADQRQYLAGRSNPMRCGILGSVSPPATTSEAAALLEAARANSTHSEIFVQIISASKRLVVFLDTLEEASLVNARQLLDVLRLARTLRSSVGAGFRLILSGRYELGREHLPEFREEFAQQLVSSPMPGFVDTEATAFLQAQMNQTAWHLIPAMVEKAGGIPFHLSLFVEWAKDDPSLTAEKILLNEKMTAIHLIERIIKRIPYHPLRWVIRYGVVPRTLSIGFLRDCMRQPLVEALSGASRRSGEDRAESDLEQDVWLEEPGFVFDAEKLWNDHVLPYAGSRDAWLVRDDDDPKVLRFRPDVRSPMRMLLARQKIFGPLHQRARDFYAAQARDAALWPQASVEVIYHAWQAGDPELMQQIAGAFDADLAWRDPVLRIALATQLGGPDFSAMPGREKAYVEYRWAEAIAARENYSYRNSEAMRHLAVAIDLDGRQAGTVLPAFARAWIRLSEKVTISELLKTMDGFGPEDRLQLGILMADMLARGNPLTADLLEIAKKAHAASKRPPVPIGAIAERAARYYQSSDHSRAAEEFRQAAHGYERSGGMEKGADLRSLAASMELNAGHLARAEREMTELHRESAAAPGITLRLARVELSKGQPSRACSLLDTIDDSNLTPDEMIEKLILRASALSQKLMWSEAQALWEQALGASEQANRTSAVARCRIGLLKLNWWYLRRTDYVVGSPGLPTPGDELDVWMIASGNEDLRIRRTNDNVIHGESPSGIVRLILICSGGDVDLLSNCWKQLSEEIEKIARPARWLCLVEPVLQGPRPRLEQGQRDFLKAAFEHTPESGAEAAFYAIRYAELLGWLGFARESVNLLSSIHRPENYVGPENAWKIATYRERRRVEWRLSEWGYDVRCEPDDPELWEGNWRHTPLRMAAALVENAQRAHKAGSQDLVRRSLEAAIPVLKETPFTTIFHTVAIKLRSNETQMFVVDPRPVPGLITPPSAGLSFLVFKSQAGRVRVGDSLISTADNLTVDIAMRTAGVPRRLVRVPLAEIRRDLEDFANSCSNNGTRPVLRMPFSALSAVPWELGFAARWGYPIRTRSGLADGGFLPRSATVASGSRPTLFLGSQTGGDLESPAAAAYADLARMLGPSLPFEGSFDPASIRMTEPPAMIYIACSFVETAGVLAPAVAGWNLEPRALVRWITSFKGWAGAPTSVVLDVPTSGAESHTVHQLLLRNIFAQKLLDSRAIPCVLGIGLQERSALAEMHHRFYHLVAERRGAGQLEVLDAMHTVPYTAPTVALFTLNPEAPFGDFSRA